MENFRKFAAADPERVRLIDASQPPNIVTDSLMENLSDLMT